MKKLYTCALLLFGLTALTIAQETNSAPVSSGLQLNIKRTDAERVEFLMNTAKAYLAEDETDAAINALERLLAIDPDNHQANYILSFVYIEGKQYLKAEKLLLELSNKHPGDFTIWNNLAWLYATAEDPKIRNGKKAVRCAQEAMTLAPNDHHIWSTLSEAYYISGDYEKANRAIIHMAQLAQKATDMTQESVAEYNQQLQKCKRALDAYNAMKEKEE